MKCEKCKREFDEKELQLSHDIPKYMGGTDADGRHWLCKRCHDIYERLIFSLAWKFMPETKKKDVHNSILNFIRKWLI